MRPRANNNIPGQSRQHNGLDMGGGGSIKRTSIEIDMPRIRNLYKSGMQPPSQVKSLLPINSNASLQIKFTPDDSVQLKPPTAGSVQGGWQVQSSPGGVEGDIPTPVPVGNNFELSISGELVIV
jgi:hypothetical protein